jgi:hypothetical protein
MPGTALKEIAALIRVDVIMIWGGANYISKNESHLQAHKE